MSREKPITMWVAIMAGVAYGVIKWTREKRKRKTRGFHILVQISAYEESGRERRPYYPFSELYALDWEADTFEKCPRVPPLLEYEGYGSLVAIPPQLFVMGGETQEEMSEELDSGSDLEEGHVYQGCHTHNGSHVHHKSSFLELGHPFRVPDDEAAIWKPGPILNSDDNRPHCIAFKGKMYSLGGHEQQFLEVFDPKQHDDDWKWNVIPLPPPSMFGSSSTDKMERLRIASPLLADPTHDRIVIFVPHLSCILAYHPPHHLPCHIVKCNWKILARNFSPWSRAIHAIALVDGVIYFFEDGIDDDVDVEDPYHTDRYSFFGYDLNTNKSIQVNVLPAFTKIPATEYCALLNLPDKTLCLAGWHHDISRQTLFYFLHFKVHYTHGSCEAQFSLLSVRKHGLAFPRYCDVTHFIPYQVNEEVELDN